MPQDGLRINLFGRVSLRFKGVPFDFHGPDRSLALFAYLLLHRERELTRDGVAFTLWPDLPESAARGRLRKSLHSLIVALPREENVPWVLSNKRFIRWNPSARAQTDLEEFTRFSGEPRTFGRAIALYRGDLLCDLDEEWLLGPRTDFRDRFLSMLAKAIDAARADGDHATTSLYARRALEVDPWREDALRALLSALHDSGDRAGAVRLYREFASNLRSEVGIDPSPATLQLFESLCAATAEPAYGSKTATHETGRASRRDNLPATITPFVGREREIEGLREAIAGRRLVTLSGVGGIGKSRLALETVRSLVRKLPDGIWLVELASIQDPASVASRIGSVLDIRERAGETILETLVNALRGQTLLLLLDNCEHLIEGVANVVERLLEGCPQLRIVATSREPLRIFGEHIEPVEPLPTPADGDDVPTLSQLSATPASRLFLLRAADRGKTFRSPQLDAEGRRALAGIVRRLDGIPLAIELAAACTDLLTLPQLEANLHRRLELLTSGSRTAPGRHQTLRATLDWSYGMLSETEQRVFERLGVFRGGWSLEAATSVCGDSAIAEIDIQLAMAGLLRKSLLFSTQRGLSRGYNMLETMRLYALERLDLRAEVDAIRFKHLNWCIAAVIAANGTWIRPEAARCVALLRPELDNILQALCWSFANKQEAFGIRLTHAARTALSIVSLNEMVHWAPLALKALGPGTLPAVEADLLWDLAGIRYQETGDATEWLANWKRALEIYRKLPDRRCEALALSRLVEIYHLIREDEEARSSADSALEIAFESQDIASLGYAYAGKAMSLPNEQVEARRKFMLQAIECLNNAGEESYSARAFVLLAEIEFENGNVELALQNAAFAIDRFTKMGLPHFAYSAHTNMPMYLNAAGRFPESLKHGCEFLPLQLKYGHSTIWTLLHIAAAAARLNQLESATRLLGYCRFTLSRRSITMWLTDAREAEDLAQVLRRHIDATALASLFREGESLSDSEAVALALSLPSRCLGDQRDLQPTTAD